MHDVSLFFLYFLIYAFLGYICEVVYVALCTKKITNRGYLYGPLVPIYGFGAIGMILALKWVYSMDGWWWPLIVFVIGFFATSLLEYVTSYLMEVIFHMRWWDYSDKFCNINGRVCLRNSSMFGALVVIVMYVLHPYAVEPVISFVENLGDVWLYVICGVLLSMVLTDLVFSTIKHVNVSKIIRKLEALAKEAQITISEKADELAAMAREKTAELSEKAKERTAELSEKAKERTAELSEKTQEKLNAVKEYLADTSISKTLSRIQIHYPTLRIRESGAKKRYAFAEFVQKVKNRITGE